MSELRANYTTISFLFSGLDRSRWFVSVERFSCDFSTVLGYVAGIGCLGIGGTMGSVFGEFSFKKRTWNYRMTVSDYFRVC